MESNLVCQLHVWMFDLDAVVRNVRSFLTESLLNEWASGDRSTVSLVRTARAAKRDGLENTSMLKLSSLGSESLDNCQRDMYRLLNNLGAFDHILDLDGPVFTSCILPSDVVQLVGTCQNQFRLRLGPTGADSCLEFWDGLFSSVDGQHYKRLHPHLAGKSSAQLAYTIPCVVHEVCFPRVCIVMRFG